MPTLTVAFLVLSVVELLGLGFLFGLSPQRTPRVTWAWLAGYSSIFALMQHGPWVWFGFQCAGSAILIWPRKRISPLAETETVGAALEPTKNPA